MEKRETLAETAVSVGGDGSTKPFTWYSCGTARWTDEQENPTLITRLDLPYFPLRERPALFLEFADLSGDRESFQRFALEFGPLFRVDGEPERYAEWKDEHKRLGRAASLLDSLGEGKATGPGRERARARLGAAITEGLARNHVTPTVRPIGRAFGPGLQLTFRVVNLAGGMWLQLAIAAEGGRKYISCEVCGRRMDVTSAPSHKRACSASCRSRRAYLRRTGRWPE